MNHKIPCHMIQDLLPLYADGLASAPTAREIEAHLENCTDCRESYGRMSADIGQSRQEHKEESQKEIDYLKTLRVRTMRNICCGVGAAVLIILAVISAKLFVIGSPSESYMTTYINVNEEQIHVGGMFWDSASVYSRHKLVRQKDGTQKLVIYACLASPWNRNGVFNLSLDMSEVENEADICGNTVKKDGVFISRQANELYRARNPYIGDISANGRLAGILKIDEHLGGFKNELQTSGEPYGWTLIHEDSVRNSAVFEAQMKDYGCVFLALIDNLGEVTWTYTVETQEGAVRRQTTLTIQEASDYLGAPVKSFGESPEMVQELLDRLNLS